VHNEAKCDLKDRIKTLEFSIQPLKQQVKDLENIVDAQNKSLSKQAKLEDQIKRLGVACEEKEERYQRLKVEKDNEIYNYNLTITEYDNREKVDADKIETLAKKLRQAIEERRRLESQLATITERMSHVTASTIPSLSETTELEITIAKALSCMQRMLNKYDLILLKTEDAIHDLHRVAEETSLHPQPVSNVRPAMYDALAAVRRIKDIVLERRRLSSQVQSLLARVNNIDQTGSSIEVSTTDDA
jgi:chromosome segregation ATPase